MAEPLPSRVVATVSVPDTPLITSAIALAREVLSPMGFNHVMRSFVLGTAIADQLAPGRDRELHAVAAVLHDLGWDTTGRFVSADKRFEVDGADAARAFVRDAAAAAGWDLHRLQLLWDAIALHTSPSIAQHKQPEVAMTALGIYADFAGPAAIPAAALAPAVWDAVRAEFPRDGFRDGVIDILCGFCRSKPATTYDNFVGEFGDHFLTHEGYSREGKKMIDTVRNAPD